MEPQDELREESDVRTTEDAQEAPAIRKLRGFAAMDRTLVAELAQRGGKAAHRVGTAHQFTSDEARLAGRKGGLATHAKRAARRADGLATKS